jgi:hypothetical protein
MSDSFAYAHYAEQRGKVSSEVTYKPETVVFDAATTERALRSVSPDGSIYLLDTNERPVGELKQGSVLFLYGVALRKVTKVESRGSTTTVSTVQADLTDAIQDGKLQWEVPVDFKAGAASMQVPHETSWFPHLFDTPIYAAESSSGKTFKGSFYTPFATGPVKYEVKFTAESSHHLKIEAHFKTTFGGAVIDLRGGGYVENLRNVGSIKIEKACYRQFDYSSPGFNGKALFTWTAQQQGIPLLFKELKIDIPGVSWKIPLVIGGFPFILEISANVKVTPALTSKGSYSTGQFLITYNGTE